MKISGTSLLNADRETVWRALNDPAVLVATIPGCQRLEAITADAFKMTIAAGVGTIKGVYDGEVRLHDQKEPGSFRMHAQGAGAPGTIGADVVVTLESVADGCTSLVYEADATVGGMIGGVGQRMLTGVSKKMAQEFFGNVDTVLAGTPATGLPEEGTPLIQPDPSSVGAPSSVRSTPGPAGSPVAGPVAGQVFTAPAASNAPSTHGSFAAGVAVGAVAALAGALVGGWLSRRRS